MSLSAFDLFSVGIGPASSHTVGSMGATGTFAEGLERDGHLGATARVLTELFGPLGATGQGHGSRAAVRLGLLGESPEQIDTQAAPSVVAGVRDTGRLGLLGRHEVASVKAIIAAHGAARRRRAPRLARRGHHDHAGPARTCPRSTRRRRVADWPSTSSSADRPTTPPAARRTRARSRT